MGFNGWVLEIFNALRNKKTVDLFYLFVCFRNKESTRYMIHTVNKFVQKTTKSLEERTEILYILLAYILR